MKVKAPRTYHGHRDRQKRRILDAARTLFDRRGIDRTAMLDIVAASGLRASTLYEYFSKKDDIVWAILGDFLKEDSENAKKSLESAKTGLAKISALLGYMSEELSKKQAKIRFMAQFDAMYSRDWPVERLLTLEGQLNGELGEEGLHIFGGLIREGIADGSLRPDLDPELTLHAVINAVIGAQRRLASLGTKVEAEYGQPIDRLFQEMIRIIILGISTPAQNRKPSSGRAVLKSRTRKKRS